MLEKYVLLSFYKNSIIPNYILNILIPIDEYKSHFSSKKCLLVTDEIITENHNQSKYREVAMF